jgi:PAS domain S-box-containing protein
MQTFYKRFSVIAGFGVLLAVLVINALVTRREVGIQDSNAARVARTRLVLYELSQTELLLTDAETGQHGYLYTGDAKYLAPYNAALNQVAPHIDTLAQLTAGNPREQTLIPVLRVLSQSKLAELAHTISLYQSGKQDDAKTLVLSDIGLRHMSEIRHVVDQMTKEEASIESQRAAQYQTSKRATIASIYLASSLATLGLVLLAYYIIREMALREQHAQEIRAREEWFRVTLTSIGDAVIATDERGRVTFLNPVAEKLTGTRLASAKGKEIHEVFPIFNEMTKKTVEDPVKKVLQLGRVVGLANHTVLQCSDGSLVPIEDSAAPIRDDQTRLLGVVLVFRDVTNERKAQEVMRKTEKLAAAARLSATVAHEINNPLEAVVNLIYLAKRAPDASPALEQTLSLAEQELDRVAHLTRQTLGFYRETNVPERIEISGLIESVLKLYSNRLKNKNITVERDYGPSPPVYGVSGELKQVISNLVSNAADAVSRNGTIMVRLQCTQDNGNSVVQVVVEDDGPGIASENVDRIFEPFFTTKEDVGTGLGLWITKEIVSRHGGSILVRSHNGDGAAHGAAFTVVLPLNSDLEGGPMDRTQNSASHTA